MKTFLDESCLKFNTDWKNSQYLIKDQVKNFKEATKALIDIFENVKLPAKKTPGLLIEQFLTHLFSMLPSLELETQ